MIDLSMTSFAELAKTIDRVSPLVLLASTLTCVAILIFPDEILSFFGLLEFKTQYGHHIGLALLFSLFLFATVVSKSAALAWYRRLGLSLRSALTTHKARRQYQSLSPGARSVIKYCLFQHSGFFLAPQRWEYVEELIDLGWVSAAPDGRIDLWPYSFHGSTWLLVQSLRKEIRTEPDCDKDTAGLVFKIMEAARRRAL